MTEETKAQLAASARAFVSREPGLADFMRRNFLGGLDGMPEEKRNAEIAKRAEAIQEVVAAGLPRVDAPVPPKNPTRRMP